MSTDIDAIRARWAAATPGPYFLVGGNPERGIGAHAICSAADRRKPAVLAVGEGTLWWRNQAGTLSPEVSADTLALLSSWEDIHHLLDHVDHLRAHVELLQTELEHQIRLQPAPAGAKATPEKETPSC